jgi:alpha-galactosidase
MKEFQIEENGLYLVFEIAGDGSVRLLHFSAFPYDPASMPSDEKSRRRFTLVEVHCTGESQRDHHGGKHTGSNPGGGSLRYIGHSDSRNSCGRKMDIVQESDRLRVTTHMQFYDGIPAARCWTEILNISQEPAGLEYVSSFALTGLTKEAPQAAPGDLFLHIPHHSWKMEFQWRRTSLDDLGLTTMSDSGFTMKRAAFSNTGSWAAKEFLPQAVFEIPASGSFLFWAIEAPGSWQWEIAEISGHFYLQAGGPSERENQWWKNLQPGETFEAVPVIAGAASGSLDEVFVALTACRRAVRRPHRDNVELPVIFNDYMNCLMGDATTEKLLPLIDKAAAVGAEYFVIDGGWYDDGPWWDGVGEWLPSKARFPNGIEEPVCRIREQGMVPGLWLEMERMGIHCRLASEWPDECFFIRHGKRVIDHDSLHLDFRHQLVREHADCVVRRLVEEYGVGFIKMDYNFEIGPGTELAADSFGDGLLQHQRAYRGWLIEIMNAYPDLIIENCSSGGLRLTGGLMDLHSVASVSDNQNWLLNALISVNCATGVSPEQAGIWVYPLADADEESVIMNMVNGLSWRMFLSGQMQSMDGVRLNLIQEAVDFYKQIRTRIPLARPRWPLGLARPGCGWSSFALQRENEIFLSVWRFDAEEDMCCIPLPEWAGYQIFAECVYPLQRPADIRWLPEAGLAEVSLLRKNTARIFRLIQKE